MVTTTKKSRYKQAEGKHWIEVRIRSPLQLFDARDPAPFRERDLDDDFVTYIVNSAREFTSKAAMKVVIYVEENESRDLSKSAIRDAIHTFLAYEIDLQRSELKSFLKRAQVFLVLGIAILMACIGVAQSLTVPQPPGLIGIIREGIVIFGWVSIWKPIELILFDWYPLFEKLRLYKKLLATEIEIRFGATA